MRLMSDIKYSGGLNIAGVAPQAASLAAPTIVKTVVLAVVRRRRAEAAYCCTSVQSIHKFIYDQPR